jgi:hypothetical protein
MAQEKNQEKEVLADLIKMLIENYLKKENTASDDNPPGIDPSTLMAILSTFGKEGKEKGIDTILPVLLLYAQQKPNTLDNLMQMFLVSKLIDEMTQKKEDDFTKAFKFKMMIQMMEGGKKESAIDDFLKLMQVFNPSRASEIEKLRDELLRMNETNQKSIEEIKRTNEEMKRTSETNLSQLRNEILTLYKDLTTTQQSGSFKEEMQKQLEFQRQVREYAQAMGWIKAMGLPSTNEDWQPDDYLTVINKIAETATNVVGAMTGMRAGGKKERTPEVEKIPEIPQVQEQPAPQPQPQPTSQLQPQPAPAPKEEKKLDPEVEEYVKNMQVTDSGFIDQYGNSYVVQEGKPDYNAFKQWAYENPDQIKDLMEKSRQDYERSLAKQKHAELQEQPEEQPKEQVQKRSQEQT